MATEAPFHGHSELKRELQARGADASVSTLRNWRRDGLIRGEQVHKGGREGSVTVWAADTADRIEVLTSLGRDDRGDVHAMRLALFWEGFEPVGDVDIKESFYALLDGVREYTSSPDEAALEAKSRIEKRSLGSVWRKRLKKSGGIKSSDQPSLGTRFADVVVVLLDLLGGRQPTIEGQSELSDAMVSDRLGSVVEGDFRQDHLKTIEALGLEGLRAAIEEASLQELRDARDVCKVLFSALKAQSEVDRAEGIEPVMETGPNPLTGERVALAATIPAMLVAARHRGFESPTDFLGALQRQVQEATE